MKKFQEISRDAPACARLAEALPAGRQVRRSGQAGRGASLQINFPTKLR